MKRFDKGFVIRHHTVYAYDQPTFFEPHYLRFQIRNNPHMQLKAFNIDVEPMPAVRREMIDAEDNRAFFVSFEEKHASMEILSTSEVLIADFNPFNFIIFPDRYLQIGFEYDKVTAAVLAASLIKIPVSETLAALNEALLQECKSDTVQYLILLTATIHRQFKKINRHDGPPLMPKVLENAGEGSCRDLAYLQMAMGRSCGLACRFVSGYVLDEGIEKDFDLHAWTEMYLPGAGWIGFDPSTGLAVDSRYVPVASSAFPENTLPVSGHYRGDARSKLTTRITVEKLFHSEEGLPRV